jgi:hypothetical protein
MPFSTLKDPTDVARAHAALERAWAEIKRKPGLVDPEGERERLAYIIASYVLVALDEDDLVERALTKFCAYR